MEYKIIVTGILLYEDKFLVVKRSDDDDFMPGAWEFPGGNVELGETIEDGLKRELNEEIGLSIDNSRLIGYSDEIKNKNDKVIHVIELDFLIDCLSDNFIINLSNEHSDYKWVTKDSDLLDDFIKNKIKNI